MLEKMKIKLNMFKKREKNNIGHVGATHLGIGIGHLLLLKNLDLVIGYLKFYLSFLY